MTSGGEPGGPGPGERTWEDRNPFRPERPSPMQRPTGLQRYRMLFILAALFIVVAVVKGTFGKVDTHGARSTHFVVFSDVLAEKPGKPKLMPAIAVVPAGGGEGRPLLLLVAGRGQPLDALLDKGWYASLLTLGLQAPDVAIVSVPADSQAHDRSSGKWGTYLLQDAVAAAVKQTGADPKRVAIGGFDMGGFGALVAARTAPTRFCAVGAASPELWSSFGLAPAGAFDDAADFARNDILGAARAGTYPDVGPIRLDVGSDDPQLPQVKQLAAALTASGRDVSLHVLPGHASIVLWRAESGNMLRFYATALAACTGRG